MKKNSDWLKGRLAGILYGILFFWIVAKVFPSDWVLPIIGGAICVVILLIIVPSIKIKKYEAKIKETSHKHKN